MRGFSLFSVRSLLLLFFFFGILLCGSASSQDVSERGRQHRKTSPEDKDRYGIEAELEEEEEELSQELEFDYGGIFRFTLYDFDDTEDVHTLRVTDLRLWANLVYKDMHQIYVRILNEYIDYNSGSEYFYQDENNWNINRMDVGYYQTDLTRVMGWGNLGRLRLKGGRDYYNVGTGMMLDRRGDGTTLEYTLDSLSFKGFIMRTIASEDSPDRSHPDFGHDKRLFSGLEIGNEFSTEMEAFGYLVFNRFKNRKEFATTDQKFGNDSIFWGVGLRGQIGPCLSYASEFSKEDGMRYSDGTREKSDVDAWAFNFETEYTFRTIATQPRISAQYTHGSGDPDAGNTLDTVGGNVGGTDYKAYTQYGYVNTGLVFFPRISNMVVTRLGFAFTPLKDDEDFGELEMGISGFHFKRDDSSGGVSDRFVRLNSKAYLGREGDIYFIWRPFSDLNVIGQYGIFKPNRDSFTSSGKRHYFSLGVSVFF